MRILVTGGRDFNGREALFAVLDRLHGESPITMVIHGGARGADAIAGEWARTNAVSENVFKPDWSKGKFAGLQRNGDMLAEQPDLVVAAPGGKGTADMVAKARKKGFKIVPVAG